MEIVLSTQKAKPKPLSLKQEIIYLAKLMRSIILHQFRYEEAVDNATWRRIFLTAGIATVVSTIMVQITLIIFRFYNLGGRVSVNGNGFATIYIADVPAFHLSVILVDILFALLTGFIVIIALSYIIAYCIQLWFRETGTNDRHELLGIMQAVIIVKSIYLIPIRLVATVYSEVGMFRFSDPPARLFTVYTDYWFPEYISPLILFLSLTLPIYGYFVLYCFFRNQEIQVNHFWMKFTLIVILMQGLSIVFWQQIRILLSPLYYQILSYII